MNTKSIYLILIVLLFGGLQSVSAQSLNTRYTFSQLQQTYSPITGGTIHGTPANDDQLFTGIPIGFVIAFNGASYNTIGISPNGYIWLGTTAPPAATYNPLSNTATSSGFVSAFGRNLESRSATGGGELRSQLTGTSPNRVFTVQWKNYQRFTSGTSDNGDIFNFQIKLFEFNQRIEIIYGSMIASANASAQVGLRGTNASDYMNRVVNATYAWNNSIAGTANTAVASYTTTRLPVSGQTYRWTPTSLLNTEVSGGGADTVSNYMEGQLVNSTETSTASVGSEGGINSLGIQRFINGVSEPWVAMNKLSGDNNSGTWQVSLPAINQKADVFYLYRIINPDNFFLYTGKIAYEVGYLRTYAGADKTQPSTDPLELKAECSVSPLLITEVVLDRLAPGGNPSTPSYAFSGDADLIELTNLSPDPLSLDGYTLKVFTSSTGYVLDFPPGLTVPGGSRIVVHAGGNAGQYPTGLTDEWYFETGGPVNSLTSSSPAGFALFNRYGDVLDALALNDYRFDAASGVRMVHLFGETPSVSGSAGVERMTMKDHNSGADWSAVTSSNIGQMNSGLSAVADAPSFIWSSPDLPGWSEAGSVISVAGVADGTYSFIARCNDKGFFSDDTISVTLYTPAAPVSDFTASAITGYPGDIILFTDISANYPDNREWIISPGSFTFTSGTGASSVSPSVAFSSPGFYTVTLQVSNADGSDSETKTDFIQILPFAGVCVKPSGLSAAVNSPTSVTISWDQGYYADSMQVRYGPDSGNNNSLKTVFTTSGFVTLNGLSPGVSYNFRVRPWCGGAVSDGFTSKYHFTTSPLREYVAPVYELHNLNVYPNPASNMITVGGLPENYGCITANIINITGKVIKALNLSSENPSLDISEIPAGVYMLSISTRAGGITYTKFIKH
jgi:PKD repeat protein